MLEDDEAGESTTLYTALDEPNDEKPARIAEMFDPRSLIDEGDTSVDQRPFGATAARAPAPNATPAPRPVAPTMPDRAAVHNGAFEDAPTALLPSQPPPPVHPSGPTTRHEPARPSRRWLGVGAGAAVGALLVGVGFLLGVSNRAAPHPTPSGTDSATAPSATPSAAQLVLVTSEGPSASPPPAAPAPGSVADEANASASAAARAHARPTTPSTVAEPTPPHPPATRTTEPAAPAVATVSSLPAAPPAPIPSRTTEPARPTAPPPPATPTTPSPAPSKGYVSPVQNPGF